MDDTTQSKTSDVAASAASRKRRSSILKSQRPPRTPFCELEFNVTTPTDTGKSRRVSFSRKTEFAEFVTNEATTTWKNFYEEHNKSLESSRNDSEMNRDKQPVAHLGKRIFDQQFEEVEAVDYVGTFNRGISISSSINSINFAQHECTEKLTAPQTNFELSAFTEAQSKLFENNLGVSGAGEVSDRIDVNFSAIQQIEEKDDLDEIQKDLQRQSNIVCPGPFTGQNLSEYIEVDLDMTHVALANAESDMSITDTVHSPKVQDVSKSCSIDKKVSMNEKDWIVDKENIAINPYVAPRESLNFAINEEPNKVLVFDGKRLIVESEKPPERVPQRKTIVLNCNDDLPNFLEESQILKNTSCFVPELKQSMIEEKPACHGLDETKYKQETIIFDDLDNISVTQAVPNVITDLEKRRTIVYDNDFGNNISITQALPPNIIDNEKRKTIIYDDEIADISVTQAVPANVILPKESNEKRKTILFNNDACDISMTQAIPAKIIVAENPATANKMNVIEDGIANASIIQPILNTKNDVSESRRTAVYENNTGNISVTHSIITSPNAKDNVPVSERSTTVVFGSDTGNVSVTQALPTNIKSQKLNATTYDDDTNISMTQAIPVNILLNDNSDSCMRRTLVFEDDKGNLSITQAVPKNQVIQGRAGQQPSDIETNINRALHQHYGPPDIGRTAFVCEDRPFSNAVCINEQPEQEISSNFLEQATENKRRTILFQNEASDISITKAIPNIQLLNNIHSQHKVIDQSIESIKTDLYENCSSSKRKTILFENDDAFISMTQSVPLNQVFEAANIPLLKVESTDKRNTVAFANEDADISLTQAVFMNQVIDKINELNRNEVATQEGSVEDTNKRRTIVFENVDADISMTQAVPMNQLIDIIQDKKFKVEANNENLQKESLSDKRETVFYEENEEDISMTEAESMNQIVVVMPNKNQKADTSNDFQVNKVHKRSTIIFEKDDMTQTASMNRVTIEDNKIEATDVISKDNILSKTTTVAFEDNNANSSTAQVSKFDLVSCGLDNEQDQLAIASTEALASVYATSLRPAVNEDDDDTSVTYRDSAYSIISADKLKKKESIDVESVESLLENNDNFMDFDELIEMKSKILEKKSAINESHFVNIETPGKKAITINDNGSNVVHDNLSLKNQNEPAVTIDETPTLSKSIICTELSVSQKRLCDKFQCRSSKTCDDSKTNTSIAAKDVFVYQTMTNKAQNILGTHKEDSQETTVKVDSTRDEEKLSSYEFDKVHSEFHGTEEMQSEQLSKSNAMDMEPTKKINDVDSLGPKAKSTILTALLDMSQSDSLISDQELVFNKSNVLESPISKNIVDNKISDNMFYIIKDSEEERTNKSEVSSREQLYTQEKTQIKSNLPLSIDHKNDDELTIVQGLERKLSILKDVIREDHVHFNLKDENVESKNGGNVSLDKSKTKGVKSFKSANDTKELLEMISDFTDKTQSGIQAYQEMNEVDEESKSEEDQAQENKMESSKPEPARFNRTLKRQSVVLSREDLLNNVSMASAMLQKSRSDFDDSESSNDAPETPIAHPKKIVRMSPDIVKQLQFDEDSISEESETNQTPLKKTAFGEISYMREPKKNVIPHFLDKVSDGVKELMDDLIKPMSDVLPYNTLLYDKNLKTSPSTHSMQLQTNLLNSSQIDLNTELISNSSTVSDINTFSSPNLTDDVSKTTLISGKPISVLTHSEKQIKMDITPAAIERKSSEKKTVRISPSREAKDYYSDNEPGNVLIFDHNNPLNNVLLAAPAPHAVDIHRYCPRREEIPETQSEEKVHHSNCVGIRNTSEDIVSTQYHLELSPVNFDTLNKPISQNTTNDTKEHMLVDRYTEPDLSNIKDMEINTDISMKANKELLQVNSSLILVCDDSPNSNRSKEDAICDPQTINISLRSRGPSPVKVIYIGREELSPKTIKSDLTSAAENDQSQKPKKRVYSPTKREKNLHCTLSSLEITPKPSNKMAKRSVSPIYVDLSNLPAKRDPSPEPLKQKYSPTRQKSPRKLKNKKPGTAVTVQQVMMSIHLNPTKQDRDVRTQERTDSSTTDPRSVTESHEVLTLVTSSEIVSSFTSSNNIRADSSSGQSRGVSVNPSNVEWTPESISSSIISTNGEPGEDIVALIDAMPFMGSNECQWECINGSVWSLLMLHCRLRLTIRFESAPSLRPNTPILNMELEALHQDKKNPIAYLCVIFCAEVMRYHMDRGCVEAHDVIKLVRRLAATTRLAVTWAKAMHDARTRLAISLASDGWLALKVANTSCRAVWEVSMRLELVVQHACAAPWPRACHVRVSPVLAGGARAPDVSRLLAATPRDWGHVPRTIWRVFRFLKHKKRGDDATLCE